MIPFLGASPTQANASLLQASDPLRLLLSGSTASVQVAVNPENGVAGIIFQGVFYPASLPDNVKLGELLKVMIQTEAELMLLKILSENDDSTQTTKSNPSKAEILKPEEKKLLRDAFKPDTKEISNQNSKGFEKIINEKPSPTAQEIKEQIKVFFTTKDLNQLQPKFTQPTSNALLLTPSNLFATSPKQETLQIQDQPAIQLTSTQKVPQYEKIISALVESLMLLVDRDATEISSNIPAFSKSVAHAAQAVIAFQDLPEEEIYKVIKSVLKKLLGSEGSHINQPINSAEKEISQSLEKKIAEMRPEQLSLLKPAKLELAKFDKNLAQPVVGEGVLIVPAYIKESIQTVVQQFLKTTEVIEKIHSETQYLPQSVYFVVPFAQPLGTHSVEFFLPREKENKKKRQRRSSRSHMKITLPIIGDIRIEFLTINDEAHIKIIVESEEIRQKISEHKFVIEKAFHEIGLNIPSLFIECGKVGSIKPLWLKEQLGVEALA